MARRKRLTDEGVRSLPTRSIRYTHPDPELPCHYIRIQPSGTKSFVVVTNGGRKWHTIGDAKTYTIEQARERARKIIQAARDGESPPERFQSVAATWREEHAVRKGLRSINEIDRHLVRLNDAFGGRDFADIKRIDVANLVSRIAKEHGDRQAEYALQTFRAMANWYSRRHGDYSSPVVPGMSPRVASECARDRILSDDEIRAVWKQEGQFADFVKLLLVTAQRKEKVASMRWQDVEGDVWTIPSEKREKGNAGELVLPQAALDIIERQRRFVDNEHVFAAARGTGHINGFSKSKRELNSKLGKVPQWQLHDLRRSAKSLMSHAGVRPDISERVLGHAIPGVEGVYDQHSYLEQKAQALKMLAGLVDEIVSGTTRVVKMRATRR
jgi:integrase